MTIDVNVSLSQWPCRRLPLDNSARLAQELSRLGITQAWAGTFDAILHNDVAAANQRLADECRSVDSPLFLPFGAVNLSLPAWEEDVRRCHEVHGMRGLRILPGYHDVALDNARFAKLLGLATERRLIVQIAVRLEDPRTQHRLLSVKDVDLKPLLPVLRDHPHAVVVLLNALNSVNQELHSELTVAGQVFFDIATLEGLAGLERQLKSLPAERILLGTHAPFFAPESAVLKLKESELPAPMIEQISQKNAVSLLAQNSIR